MIMQSKQAGSSIIGVIIGLAIIGFGTYVGIQYIPQYVESSAVESILIGVAKSHKTKPFTSTQAVQSALDKQLDVNQMYDLKDSFSVMRDDDTYIITANYERDLNLIYTSRKMIYDKSKTLK